MRAPKTSVGVSFEQHAANDQHDHEHGFARAVEFMRPDR